MVTRLCKQFFGAFYRDNSGAVAIMFVGFLNVMLGMLALSLDLGRGYMASSEIQNAATAASISSAMENGDVEAARRYFTANLPNGQHSIGYDFDSDVQVIVNGSSVSVKPTGFDVPAYFPMGKVSASAGGNGGFIQVWSISTVGMPQGAIQPADYFFALDISGSMNTFDSVCPSSGSPCSRIASVNDAVTRVATTISKATDAENNYGIAYVTWAGTFIDSLDLTSDFATAIRWAKSNLFAVNSSTCGSCGLNVTATQTPDSTSGRTKVVIFMTDGSMNSCEGDYDCGCQSQCSAGDYNCLLKCSEVKAFQETEDSCDFVKSDPEVTLWAITFGTDIYRDKRNQKLRDYCASAPEQSVHVNNGQELDALFNEIFNKTGKIRVTN